MTECVLCGSTNITIFSNDPYILNCNECQNSFRGSRPKDIDYSANIKMPDYFTSKLRSRHHYKFIEKTVGFSNIRSVLEIGSGDGVLIRQIRKRHKNIKISVIEPGSIFCKGLRQIENVDVINDYIENVQLNEKFDLVIMSHVLEHLEDPIHVLKHVRNMFMGDGSFLYIDVPNRDYELRSTYAARVAPPIHLIFFDALGLIVNLVHLGFSEKNIVGCKYSSLPSEFIERMECIGRCSKERTLRLICYKVLNRLSLFRMNVFRTVSLRNSAEISFCTSNSKYNNIAIMAAR